MTENLLVIISDEHQAAALSCLGHFVKTPNLDRLAAKGTLFRRAYTPSPIVFLHAPVCDRTLPSQNTMLGQRNALPWPMAKLGTCLATHGIDVEALASCIPIVRR